MYAIVGHMCFRSAYNALHVFDNTRTQYKGKHFKVHLYIEKSI